MDFGYHVAGLDVHPAYADHVRRLGVEFLLGDITTYDFHARQFDIVSMGDVIEHVADPNTVIARITHTVKPGGLIWLSTPNYEGVWTRALREKDGMWKECEHLQFFCLRSLTRLLEDHGWKISDYNLSKRYLGCAEIVAERKPPGA
jgi:2-polyprenyl-3-methyl-5-hydroxy-6-metoxy-1,4-benzoquinol methylase